MDAPLFRLERLRRTPSRAGFAFAWRTVLLLAAINTGIAAVLWIDDTRPFWQPLLTVQLYGFAIAYCVNAAAPWSEAAADPAAAGRGGARHAHRAARSRSWSRATRSSYVLARTSTFGWNVFAGFANGLFVSLFFYLKIRESQAAAALHKAEVERHLLSKQAIEAELKLMQAQVEPHFLFNTLASVQYLTETDPVEANRLLGHLIEYLRAALPHLRARRRRSARRSGLAEAYLNILRMRMGARLAFIIDVPGDLATHPFPPNLLISLVENAIKHGIEPAAQGGTVAVRARREGRMLIVTVEDTGRGLGATSRPGGGVGLANIRERLAALYGTQAQFSLERGVPTGARATLAIPLEADLVVVDAAEPRPSRRSGAGPVALMSTAILAEDEPLLRAQLKARLAEAWPELRIVAEAGNGAEALALFDLHEPDVMFLDIRMPEKSGLEVAHALGGRCHIVFVTAYDEYAVAAFEEGAVDYVLKPVTAERIAKVVERLRKQVGAPPADLTALLARLAAREAGGALKWIRASLGSSMKLIAIDDVLYFQAEDKYTKVVTAEGDALIKKPIKELFEELDPDAFWQIHRATIVNLRAIASVERDWRDQPLILLKDRPEKLTVSRTFASRFKSM